MVKKIISVVGARPQFIKAATLSRVLKKEKDINHLQLHTGQHYSPEMADVFFEELDYHPDFDLGIGSASHAVQTGQAMIGIEEVLLKEKPDLLIVYGDTNATLAGSLTAAKLHLPVAHVEAGLRSFNHKMPEEINRIVADALSDVLFCPTPTAVKNLAKEGRSQGVINSGDILLDALNLFLPIARKSSSIQERLSLKGASYWLLTMHRPSNVDEVATLKGVLDALAHTEHPRIIFPCHPRTAKTLEDIASQELFHVEVIPPLSYMDILILEENAELILTDSGGVQREAYFLARPCLTLRDETEWPETLEGGWNKLVGTDPARIRKDTSAVKSRTAMPHLEVFGNGKSGLRMVEEVLKFSKSC